MLWKISLEHCKELLVHNGKILTPQFKEKKKKRKKYLAVDSTPSAAGLGGIACQMSFFRSRVVSFPQ